MILSLADIQQIIKDNPGKSRVQKGVEYSKKLRRHIYGEGLEQHIQLITGYEKEEMKELRKKYCRSNKDLFSRLSRPIDKVFSARGGSIYYNLIDTQERQARVLAQDVRDGYSVRKWVEVFWKPHMLDDPFGLIFLEILPTQQAVLARQQSKSFVYPTYKSINNIFDYLTKGNRLEYIFFRLTAEEKKSFGFDEAKTIFRVVDDAFDYLVEQNNEQVTVYPSYTLPNYFGEVPGIVNSDFINPQCENQFLSLYDDIIELAEEFLIDGSIKRTHKFLHGFPKYSEFADDCVECSGTKFVGAEKCKACAGTGKKLMTKVSDVKMLPWPGQGETVILPNQVGGYVSPDKTFYEISQSELQHLEDAMSITLWGTMSRLKTEGMSTGADGGTKTATEIMDEIKPQSDRLHPISEMAETRHKFILDFMVRLQVNLSYQGSSVNYGRRYMLEGPDAIWQKYSDARKAGSAQNVLDDLLQEYYEAKYMSDPIALSVSQKISYVEPFVHNTMDELKEWPIQPFEKLRKAYFLDWYSTKSDSEILISTIEVLKQDLTNYVVAKSQEDDKAKDDTPLAVKLGVGGTQALQLILGDPNIDQESKRNTLIILFGIKEEDAKRMVVDTKIDPNKPKPEEEPIAA